MNQKPTSDDPPQPDLEADVDTVIAACGGSERAAIRALLIANEYLSAEVEHLRASQSVGYTRGRRSLQRALTQRRSQYLAQGLRRLA